MNARRDDATGAGPPGPVIVTGFPSEAELREMVVEYLRLRQLSRAPLTAAMSRISRRALQECGRVLGILRDGVFAFENEAELALLTDAMLYDRRDGGTTAVERHWRDADAVDDDHRLIRDAMLHARFSICQVEATRPDAGLIVRDVLRGDALLVLDRGLGTTAVPAMAVAMRLLPFPGWTMTSGAALPLDPAHAETILRDLPGILNRPVGGMPIRLSKGEESRLATRIMRDCIACAATDRICYEES